MSAALTFQKGMSSANELNATQGSLLGFLHDGPKTGWDLLQEVEGGLDRFWNITSSHVYRELRTLEDRGLVKAAPPGRANGGRSRSPPPGDAGVPRAGSREPPGPEQIRFPLLVTLWFARHVDPDTLAGFLEASRQDHEQRLALYEDDRTRPRARRRPGRRSSASASPMSGPSSTGSTTPLPDSSEPTSATP